MLPMAKSIIVKTVIFDCGLHDSTFFQVPNDPVFNTSFGVIGGIT